MAARTMAFDINKKEWDPWILDGCDISKEKLSTLVPSGEHIGNIREDIAAVLGISKQAEIYSGGHDQACSSLGAGVLHKGSAMDSLGSTESILCVDDHATIRSEMQELNLPCYPYVVNNLYAYLTFLSSSGSILKWLRNNFLKFDDKGTYAEMDKEIENNYKDPSEVFVLPHFSGSGTPYLDFDSKGIIAGLSLDTNRFLIYKGILEGTAFEGRLNIESMKKCGIEVNELKCVGGGSKSDLWLQIKADIMKKKIFALEVSETGCLGAAILAGIGIGCFNNANEAVQKYVKVRKEFTPNQEMVESYDHIYEKYLNLYELSKELQIDRAGKRM